MIGCRVPEVAQHQLVLVYVEQAIASKCKTVNHPPLQLINYYKFATFLYMQMSVWLLSTVECLNIRSFKKMPCSLYSF